MSLVGSINGEMAPSDGLINEDPDEKTPLLFSAPTEPSPTEPTVIVNDGKSTVENSSPAIAGSASTTSMAPFNDSR